jgi:tRNA(Ile)-lysidine synthase
MARADIWQQRARRLGELIPLSRLHPAVLAWANAADASPWGVACSGGPDSVCLLLLLWEHFPQRRKDLVALHFNHRLRAAASDADERFCRAAATGLGVAFASARWRSPRKGGGEEAARSARFAFFDAAGARRGIAGIFFGHQQDDIAETLFMRVARGSGTAGLAAPRPVHALSARGLHLRPLLTLKKRELETALRTARIPFRVDRTNGQGLFFRNRVRRDVLPAWIEASGRDALAGAALARERLEEDDAALEEWLAGLAVFTPGGALRLTALVGAPKALFRRALHHWLLRQPADCALSRQGFEALLGAILAGRPTRHSLGSHGFAVIKRGRLVYVLTPI